MKQVKPLALTIMSHLPTIQKWKSNRKKIKLIFMLAVISLLINLRPFAQNQFDGTVQAIDSYFSRLEDFGLSGSLLIGNKDEVLLKKDYGIKASVKGIDPAYLVGSITKQFTATAILSLEQKGLLNTSDEISKYLTNIPADKSAITIHQLLTHTSGLKDDYWDQHTDLTEEDYIEKMLTEKLVSEPGTKFSYANFGYHLLAKIIENIANKNYERFLKEELFKPHNLNHTGFNLVNWKENQVVEYTDWTTEKSKKLIKNPLDRPAYLQPEGSGGILSTTEDLYKWHQLIFHSEKVLSAASKKKLWTVEKENYGYGWEIYETSRGTKLIEHGAYDSWVGVVAGFYNFVEEDLVVIFLGNTHMSQILRKDDLMNNIESLVFGGSVQAPPMSNFQYNRTDFDKCIGEYEYNGKSLSITKGKLKNQIRLRTTDEGTIKQLLFPNMNSLEKRTDIQLEYVLDHISRNDYEPLKGTYFRESAFEALKNRYSGIWQYLSTSLGEYHGFSVLHTLPNIYEGKFELQIFTELLFERGSFYARAFRDHNGRIHIQNLEFPKKLELYLVPIRENEFIYWNIKTGITSTILFDQGKLIMNDNQEIGYVKN